MFHVKTVFVLGAGSSNELGFPLGKDLAASISGSVNFTFEDGSRMVAGDTELFEIIRRNFGSQINDYTRAGRFISRGIQLANSIDDFLSLHQSNEPVIFVGKLAIAKAILHAEFKCRLMPRGETRYANEINFSPLNDTWFVKLLKMLSRDVKKEEVKRIFENVSFVNFNYDRCLEFFLFQAIQRLYGIIPTLAAEIVSSIKIFHPYGSIGSLPMKPNDSGVEFGSRNVDYSAAALRIKTYSEKIEENDELQSLHHEIANAESLIFLGMQFHDQNLKLISPLARRAAKNAFATAFGLSDEDQSIVEGYLLGFLAKKYREGTYLHGQNSIRLKPVRCTELFDMYSKALADPKPIEPMELPQLPPVPTFKFP